MNVTEAIFARRSVHAYAPQKVEEATIRALLRAAVQAPSGMDRQPWVFAIVQDVVQLKRYSDRAKALLVSLRGGEGRITPYDGMYGMLRDPGFNIFYNASTLIVIGVAERSIYSDADAWLAAQNLMLAAREAGLGTCCIGFAMPLLNTPEVKAELNLAAKGAAVAPIVLGYPAAWPAAVERNTPKLVSWSR